MSKMFTRLTGVNEARVVEVIEVKSIAGDGVEDRPMYEVTEYYSLQGELLARHNPLNPDKDLGVFTDAGDLRPGVQLSGEHFTDTQASPKELKGRYEK
jgi:hypothetical protein